MANPSKAAAAMALAKTGLDASAAGLSAADLAALNAQRYAGAAAAAEAADNLPVAELFAQDACGCMLGARAGYMTADGGVGTIMDAEEMLEPGLYG